MDHCKLLAANYTDRCYNFIDIESGDVARLEAGTSAPLSLRLFPGFDAAENPHVLTKQEDGLYLLNVVTRNPPKKLMALQDESKGFWEHLAFVTDCSEDCVSLLAIERETLHLLKLY